MKKIIISIIILILIYPVFSQVGLKSDAITKTGKTYLAVIAIDKYKNRLPLEGNVVDSQEIKNIIYTKFDIDDVIELYDFNASILNIGRLFVTLRKELKEEDSLIIYYSGHGFIDTVTKEGYWIPFDAGINENLKENWFSNRDLVKYISDIKTRQILVISNTCFDSNLVDVTVPEDSLRINNEYFQDIYKKETKQFLGAGIPETSKERTEFYTQLQTFLQKSKTPFIDPVMIYDDLKKKMKNAFPLFGNIKNTKYDDKSSFVLFQRIKPLEVADTKELEKVIEEKKIVEEKIVSKEDKIPDIIEEKEEKIKIKEKLPVKEKIVVEDGQYGKLNKIGIALLPVGSSFLTVGLFLYVGITATYYANFHDRLFDYDENELETNEKYNKRLDEYHNAYDTFMSLGIASVFLTAAGTGTMIGAIPLLRYKKGIYSGILNKIGVGLLPLGTTTLSAGLMTLLYDFSVYMRILDYHVYQGFDYDEYARAYNANLSMFVSGIVLTVVGAGITAVSIPFMLYKGKPGSKLGNNLSFNIDAGSDLDLYVKYVF